MRAFVAHIGQLKNGVLQYFHLDRKVPVLTVRYLAGVITRIDKA
jgi:hypothetical protein